jgi:hypothetical protein
VRSLFADILWCAAVALVGVLALSGAIRWGVRSISGPIHESGWTQRSRAAFVPGGFFAAELDHGTGRPFSWSQASAELVFPELGRARAHRVTMTIRSGRPSSVPPATLTAAVDGEVRLSERIPDGATPVVFEIPRRDAPGATVTLTTEPAYQPGGPDPRALGVIVDSVRLEPVNGPFAVTTKVLLLTAVAIFAAALGVRLTGATGWLAFVAMAAVAAGIDWLILSDAAFLGDYAARLARLGAGAALAGALIGLARLRWPAIGGATGWAEAAAIVLAFSVVKLGVFWHLAAIVGDGIFQVHRAQVVHGGQYIFTSVTPKPFFEFPYPIALYILAQPFWSLFPTELDLLRLLRALAIVADGIVGVALYGAVVRQWGDRAAGLWAAALWPLARAPMEALSNANLTNLFGQSAFGVALAGAAWFAATGSGSYAAAATITAFLAIAFLSHFGTVTVGLAIAATAGLALWVLGQGSTRRSGVWVFGMLLVAVAVSWTVYYSDARFIPVYKASWTSVTTRVDDDSSKIVASPVVKAKRWWSGTGDDYGRPGIAMLVMAAAGAWVLVRRGARTAASLVFLAWLAAWCGMTLFGILTPITLRANLAAAPALVALCAVALAAIGSRSRLAAVGVALLVAWDGWRILKAAVQLSN